MAWSWEKERQTFWPVSALTFTTASSLPLGISFNLRLLRTCMKSLIFQTPQGEPFQASEKDTSQRTLFYKIKARRKAVQ